MESVGDRIRRLRKDILNKTQKDFGEKIGLKPNSVSDIESGKNNLTEQTANAICREFGANRDWILTGTGEPTIKRTRRQEIGAFANEVMDLPDKNIKKRLIEALVKLDERDWETIAKIADSLKEGS